MQDKKKSEERLWPSAAAWGKHFDCWGKKSEKNKLYFKSIIFHHLKNFFHLKSLATANKASNWSSSLSLYALNCDFQDNKVKEKALIYSKTSVTFIPIK